METKKIDTPKTVEHPILIDCYLIFQIEQT